MAEINLMPKGLGRLSSLTKTIKYLKLVNLLGTCLFGLIVLLSAGILLLNTLTINRLTASLEELKSQVLARQTLEQQYSLLQDRLQAIGQIYSSVSLYTEVGDFSQVYSTLKSWADISDLKVAPAEVELGVSFRSSAELKGFFEKALASDYQKIIMNSLVYKPGGGYQASFTLSKKND